ncbi:hypothetical protein [Sorangium sp. So ce131]|uniref:hypothetical protein n=1 Tax=Sorangium sp. So ce131 TaxID=3133282 RepID=UPI003F5EF98D
MSNHMTSVNMSKDSVKSGAELEVRVDYESDDGGPIHVSCGGGFSVSPASHAVGASPSGTARFPVKITRGNSTTKSCRLVFQFFNSTREKLVEVT